MKTETCVAGELSRRFQVDVVHLADSDSARTPARRRPQLIFESLA